MLPQALVEQVAFTSKVPDGQFPPPSMTLPAIGNTAPAGFGNTSVAGFRESFLQREGRLHLQNDAWQLLVEPRSFDMLLDQIPWSFATIKHPWMERVVYVEWR